MKKRTEKANAVVTKGKYSISDFGIRFIVPYKYKHLLHNQTKLQYANI